MTQNYEEDIWNFVKENPSRPSWAIANALDMSESSVSSILTCMTRYRLLERTRDRWERSSQWGLDGPAITELRDALDLYEAILRASSPQLMENAQLRRVEQVKRARGVAA